MRTPRLLPLIGSILVLGFFLKPTPPTPTRIADENSTAQIAPDPARAPAPVEPPPILPSAARAAAAGPDGAPELAAWFDALPLGALRDSVEPLGGEARRRVFEVLRELHVPREDYASLHADPEGALFYACHLGHSHAAGAKAETGAMAEREAGLVPAAAGVSGAVPISSPPIRHSRPGAPNVLYLDFNGHTITGTVWNSSYGVTTFLARPYSDDLDETTFSEWEQAVIIDVWQRVAEDFAPFDIDVTTEEPAVFTSRTGRALITKKTDTNGYAMPRSDMGGVAYLNAFGNETYSRYSPAFVYNSSSADIIAETVSHELGHNLGLSHDGQPDDEYHRGYGSGATSWGPIMGAPFNRAITQWCKGDYYGANNKEDDFAIISAKAAYRVDEAGSTLVTAAVPALSGGALSLDGVLANGADIDVFAVHTGAGLLQFSAVAFYAPLDGPRGNNADIKLELLNSTGVVVASANPSDSPNAALSYSASAGLYYVRLTPAGTGSPLSSSPTGYTAYGSAGQYTLTGSIIPASAPPAVINGGSLGIGAGSLFSFTIRATGSPASFAASGLPSGLSIDTTTGVISGRPLVTGVFSISIQATNSFGSGSAVLSLTVSAAPPVFLSQTTGGRVVSPGGTVELAGSVLSPSGAVTYQWKRNGRAISGATSAAFVISSASRLDAGYYQLVATNASGSSTSDAMFVLVAPGRSHAVGWGENSDGSLAPPESESFVALDSSGGHALAIRRDLTVAAWGSDQYSQSTVPAGLTDVVAVAAGYFHSFALRSDGTITGWGTPSYTTPPAGLSGVVAIAAGYNHTVALRRDGVVFAWGNNDDGQCTVPTGLSGVIAVAAGPSHSLALKDNGRVVAWGLNSYGQATVPAGLSGVVAVAGGYYHSLALKSDGTITSWGYAGYATPPAGLSGVIAVAAGSTHSCALKADGTAVAWGQDGSGSGTLQVPAWLGQGFSIDAGRTRSYVLRDAAGDRTPTISDHPLGQTRAESSSVTFTVAASAGTGPLAYQWRKNGEPLTGRTSSSLVLNNLTLEQAGSYDVVVSNYLGAVASGPAALVVQPLPVVALVGPARRCLPPGQPLALSVSATGAGPLVYQWYRNGRPISGATSASYAGVAATPALAGAYWATVTNAVGTRRGAICFVNIAPAAGAVVGWGSGPVGASIPGGLSNVVALAAPAGGKHAVALKADGTVVAWGNNSDGQASAPWDLSDAVAVSAGNYHSLALRADGTVVFWGHSGYGAPPSGLGDVIAIASGGLHNLALKADGTVVGWGSNGYGQATVPAGLSDVVAIAAGAYHSVAIKADGGVVAWGYNSNGQSTAPSLTTAVAAAAGGVHSLALRADGSVAGWGDAAYGAPPSGLADVVALAAGRTHSLAIRHDGVLVAWGSNAAGQTSLPGGLGKVFAVAGGDEFSLAAVVAADSFSGFLARRFDSWQLGDPAISGPAADPDGDSLPNLLEYALGLDPLDNAGAGSVGAGIPAPGMNAGRLTLTYIRRTDAPDIVSVPEVSGDFGAWSSGPDVIETVAVVPLDAARERVTVRDRAILSGSARRFIRLRVDLLP